MIFLTVGSEFHFDRLVAAIDELIAESFLTEEVVAQIGKGEYAPKHMSWVPTMPHTVYNKHIQESVAVISHAGMGTIIQCLQIKKPLLVMPRLKSCREHVNDHQTGTARKFEEIGQILVAYDTTDLPGKINQLRRFTPSDKGQHNRQSMVDHINLFLDGLWSNT